MKTGDRMIIYFFMLAFAVYPAISGCKNQISPPENLDDLQLSFVSGSIGANLMPITPPDPINCNIVLVVTNKNQTEPLNNISITQADVYLNSTNEKLGSIFFATDWDGKLGPAESDTVRLNKITNSVSVFTAPCGKYVHLNLFVRGDIFTPISFETDSLRFGCVY
jgi:hypothetical protein